MRRRTIDVEGSSPRSKGKSSKLKEVLGQKEHEKVEEISEITDHN